MEAQPPAAAAAYVRDVLRRGRAGARSHPRFPFGQYSDDTQLARELLCAITDAGGWSPAAFARRVATLVREGRDVGAGPGTRSAALRLLLGAPCTHAGTPPPYAGNGSAMRVAPAAALFAGDEGTWLACARQQSRVTHQDPRAVAGAVAVAGATVLAMQPGPLDPRAFLHRLAPWVGLEDARMESAVRGLGDWLSLDPGSAARHLHDSGLDPAVPGRWRGISPHVVPSVLWSLYAFLRSPDDWWETICVAIEVGGDTDTLAAMAGGIAGARLGVAALPGALLGRLTDRGEWGAEALTRLAADCAAMREASIQGFETSIGVKRK